METKNYITVFLLFLLVQISVAQVNIGGLPYAWQHEINQNIEIPVHKTPSLNMTEVEREDLQDEKEGLPPRFGYKHQVQLNTNNSGVWTETGNGKRLWQLEIYSPSAKSINFTFDKFWLPESGELYIYDKDRNKNTGGFTELNNKGAKEKNRGFGTGLLYDERVILEYSQDKSDEEPIISIEGIVQGYRYIRNYGEQNPELRDFEDSGDCQVNVNCSPEGDNWQDEKTGVALYIVDGDRWCTGSLINNTCNDGTLYFLTADHCIDDLGFDAKGTTDLSDFTFLWNYEAPGCDDPEVEPNLISTNGATLVANDDPSDFALFELDESPYTLNPKQRVMYLGWYRGENLNSSGAGIHHPEGDIKKVSTHEMTPIANTECSVTPENWWEISWTETTNGHSVQEPGSSGSPLLMKNGLIIGQLYGPRLCEVIRCEEPDSQKVVYGRFSVSWDNNPDQDRQLEHWLDPCNEQNDFIWYGGYLDECEPIVMIDEPLPFSPINPTIVQAEAIIQASSNIEYYNNKVEFLAGEEVQLLPGFHAKQGSDFLARIENCEPRIIQTALKIPDTGSIKKEPILSLENSEYPRLNVYPTPAVDVLNVNFHIPTDTEVSLYLTDISGNTFKKYNKLHSEGTYTTIIHLDNLPSGVYYLTFLSKKHKISNKIIIL